MDEIKDLNDLVNKVAQENPLGVNDAFEITKELTKTLPNLEKKQQQIKEARGGIIELSTHLEKVFDEIILRTNQPEKISDPFRKKAKFVRWLMEILDLDKTFVSEEFLKKFEESVIIRNLFAHVPVNLFADELEFDISGRYSQFYDGNFELKNVGYSAGLFLGNAREILDKTLKFLELVIKRAEEQREFLEEINKIMHESLEK